MIHLDQYLSTVIVALITGVFSTITLMLQRKQDKVLHNIDEQTTFIGREKTLKQKLEQKEKERESLLNDIMILILDTNLEVVKNVETSDAGNKAFEESEKLKNRFKVLSEEIEEIHKEYEIVLSMTTEFQIEAEKDSKGKKYK